MNEFCSRIVQFHIPTTTLFDKFFTSPYSKTNDISTYFVRLL